MLAKLTKPDSYDRFLKQSEACLTHNAAEKLSKIHAPTFVIGGEDDRIVTGQASREMSDRIRDCSLYMYEGLGHGLYEEAPDFLTRVREFCM
jgi:pimeloyl-ACP methyl ester carboxylesterase